MKKSKYDQFIFYDDKKNEIVLMQWDCAWGKREQWFHLNSKKSWHEYGKSYLGKALKKYELVERIPEAQQI